MKSVKEVVTESKIIERLKNNNQCLKLVKYLFEDEELQELQEYANNVSIKRLGYNDHGPVHMRQVVGNAIKMLNILRDGTWGISSLGKVEKVYLNNTNIAYAIAGEVTNVGNARETAFFSMVMPVADIVSSPAADFRVGKYTFEVGGRSKSQRQIKDVQDAYIVKDDIEYGYMNVVPLWTFGFLY